MRISKSIYGFSEVLTSNAKLRKGSTEYHSVGLSLAPASRSGHNVCAESGSCVDACVLWFAGRTNSESYRAAAIARTKLLFEDRETFGKLVNLAIAKHVLDCEKAGRYPLIRLNAASDLPWEQWFPEWFEHNAVFYDYTKIKKRMESYVNGGLWPSNYFLTYSYSERSDDGQVVDWLERGGNVSVVTDVEYNPSHGKIGKLPKSWSIGNRQFESRDGDKHDFRIPSLDGLGNIIVLRGKGGKALVARGVQHGFIQAAQ